MSTVDDYTAVALHVEDITSSLLSWEGLALAYTGNNLRPYLRMFHLLDSYVRGKKINAYSCSKKPTTSGVPRRSPIQVLTRLNPA